MFERVIKNKVLNSFKKFPIVGICGPRQSGKTTLVKQIFKDLPYINLEDPSLRTLIKQDPKGFLNNYQKGLIIDEIQYIPDLLSYLQLYSDAKEKPGQYVITGSQYFLLNEKIAQSLAGRISIVTLLPLSYPEMKQALSKNIDIYSLIFKGFYPRLHKYRIDSYEFYSNYVQTYVEKDLRQIQNITDLSAFQRFIKLCAGRIGQILNLSSLAIDCGISHVTARKWISVLEASYILYILKPYYSNFNKRIIKAPKIYFYDTGLASYLLDIKLPDQLQTHYAKGALFENYVVSEIVKYRFNKGLNPDLFYLRNKTGQEIDIVLEKSNKMHLIEIKASSTINSSFMNNINYWKEFISDAKSFLIYNGTDFNKSIFKGTSILNWRELYEAL